MNLTISALPLDVEWIVAEDPYTDDEGGAPLRCCLTNSCPGDSIRLALVALPGPRGPYAETGPVFLHADAEACPGPPDGFPEAWRERDQVLRAYSAEGRIAGGRLVKATEDQAAAAAHLLDDPEVAFVHSRNIIYGCYMFTIRRDDQVSAAAAG